jgi:hypothetical protein
MDMLANTGTGPVLASVTVMGAVWPTVMALAIVVVALWMVRMPRAALKGADSTARVVSVAFAVSASFPDVKASLVEL